MSLGNKTIKEIEIEIKNIKTKELRELYEELITMPTEYKNAIMNYPFDKMLYVVRGIVGGELSSRGEVR